MKRQRYGRAAALAALGMMAAIAAGAAAAGGGTDTLARRTAAELKRLQIKTVGRAQRIKTTLPATLSGPAWGLKKRICEQGGYDLTPYAGKAVVLTSYPIAEKYGNEPLDVWIVTSADKIACVYKTVRAGSDLAPGVFPVSR